MMMPAKQFWTLLNWFVAGIGASVLVTLKLFCTYYMLKQVSNYTDVVRKEGFHTVGKGDIKKYWNQGR